MAGHNKWSKIKRQKAVTDARRSKAWARITRDIMVAAREGGGDVDMNPRLALAVDKAKAENMPKDNIERAIQRGTGEVQGEDYVEITYEGYAPHGVAVFIEALTDNTNRTVADVRSAFSKVDGSLGTTGSVGYLFDRKGLFTLPAPVLEAQGLTEEALFLLVAEAGAEDLRQEDGVFEVTTALEDFGAVQAALEAADLTPETAELQRVPTTTVRLSAAEARQVLKLIDQLEEHPDIQAVYTNLDLDEATLAALSD